MTLINLLECLSTSSLDGIKLFKDKMVLDDCLIAKTTTHGFVGEIFKFTEYLDKEVFQIICVDYENYIDIILE